MAMATGLMPSPIQIKLVIFDLDGVLIDSRELHYEALNRALNEIDPSYVIGRQEHLAKYDGSPTSVKLHMLTSEKGLPIDRHTEVWKLKQEKTFEVINDTFTSDNRLREILAALKKEGYMLYCASNSIFNTIKLMLLRKDILEYFDYILSCEDVRNPKPSPQIYVQCCLRAGISPKETLILEDSHVGRRAALLSGCHLLPVEDPTSVTLKAIKSTIDHINANQGANPMQIKWRQPVNVVVPMCAELQEFAASGYTFPQFLVELNNKPIVQIVTENLNIEGRIIYVVSRRDYDKYSLKYVLRVISPHSTVVIAESPTDGALCSVLLAKDLINNDTPLVVANCQQLLDWDSNSFMYAMSNKEVDGGILTFANTHPRFSYVTVNDDGFVTEVAEKKPISNIATAGVYMFKRGADLVTYGTAHMESGKPGPHYLAPIYNDMIADQKKVRIKPCLNRWNLALPKDVDYFLKNYDHVDQL